MNKMIRKYIDQSIDPFKNALVTKDWCELFGSSNVSKSFEKFVRHVKSSFNLAFPLKEVNIS